MNTCFLSVSVDGCQATEEEAEQKELNKDITAINTQLTSARAASIALAKLDHTAEMQTDLKDRVAKVKVHAEKLETMVFSKQPLVCSKRCTTFPPSLYILLASQFCPRGKN